jgi:hypothetical protein
VDSTVSTMEACSKHPVTRRTSGVVIICANVCDGDDTGHEVATTGSDTDKEPSTSACSGDKCTSHHTSYCKCTMGTLSPKA